VSVLRIFRNFVIGQPSQAAVAVAHDRPETLEPRAPKRRVLHEQEIPAPETFARDRSIGLRINGEEDTRRAARLGHASRENQNVSEWIDIYGPRPQRLLRQRYRVVIGVVVARQRSPRSGVDGVAGYPQIMGERGGKAWPLYC